DDHGDGAVERAEGAARQAAARVAGLAATVVEGAPDTLRRGRTGRAALAISWPSARAASYLPPVEPHLPPVGSSRTHYQAGSACIRFGTRSPQICSRRGSIFVISKPLLGH